LSGNTDHRVLLPYRKPMDFGATLNYLAARAIPGVEHIDTDGFQRAIRAPGGPVVVTLTAADDAIECEARLTDGHDVDAVVSLLRRLLDLDADPSSVDDVLSTDPVLAPLVAKRPGLRAPGAVDGFEMAVRAVVGQQISVRGARTLLGRIAAEHGTPVFEGELRMFPSAKDFTRIDPESLPMPKARARTLLALAEACASGTLSLTPEADRASERATLLALPGIGPWTADYVQMRAMADQDILLATDLGVRKSAVQLGINLDGGREDLSPWRSYATHHLWADLH
jgi:AraC family transcriptional regulator, regulatory protein of adaptative response / DNA-3-methyladenine glycosylase II